MSIKIAQVSAPSGGWSTVTRRTPASNAAGWAVTTAAALSLCACAGWGGGLGGGGPNSINVLMVNNPRWSTSRR
jgi:hypothetical protein